MILNIYGILGIVIISFVGFYLHMVWPSLFEGSNFGVTVGLLSVLIGAIMERLGARGRIFFMPVWLLGFILAAYGTFLLWGVIGLILPALLAILAVLWLTKIIKKRDAEKWEKANEWLEQFREYTGPADSVVFWQLVKESLYFPMGVYSPAACKHNLEIVRRVLVNFPQSDATKGIAIWYGFQEFLTEASESEKSKLMDKKMETQLLEFVRARC